mmetsp:Transcript_24236/g.49062  ORF Transcript_24236/g.49062 Transcript_24236/m.49062 type:complete len:243 (+) Transcript_24236:249-977(+)
MSGDTMSTSTPPSSSSSAKHGVCHNTFPTASLPWLLALVKYTSSCPARILDMYCSRLTSRGNENVVCSLQPLAEDDAPSVPLSTTLSRRMLQLRKRSSGSSNELDSHHSSCSIHLVVSSSSSFCFSPFLCRSPLRIAWTSRWCTAASRPHSFRLDPTIPVSPLLLADGTVKSNGQVRGLTAREMCEVSKCESSSLLPGGRCDKRSLSSTVVGPGIWTLPPLPLSSLLPSQRKPRSRCSPCCK